MVSARTAVRISFISFSMSALSMGLNLSKENDTVLGTFPERRVMSDVAIARGVMHEVWPARAGRPAKACMGMIYDALKRRERKLRRECPEEYKSRQREWTERRVRSIWEGDARRIDSYEMTDLEAAAVEAAREERREYLARSERLAKFISSFEEAQGRQMV